MNSWLIKNIILIVLIILIVHFYIKNCLLERSSFTPDKTHPPIPINASGKPYADSHDSNPSYPFNHSPPQFQKNEKNDSKRAELLEYVFSDSDESLQKYFVDDAVSRPVKDLESSMKTNQFSSACKPLDNQQLPLSTTCGNNDFLPASTSMKPVIEDCNLNQEIKNGTLIKKYQDESSLNSGSLFDGTLKAYDGNIHDYAAPLD